MEEFWERALADRDFRRLALRILGLQTFMDVAELFVIDESPFGTLLGHVSEYGSDDTHAPRFLIVRDAEGLHALSVPWWVWTARGAVAWTFRMAQMDYAPEIET